MIDFYNKFITKWHTQQTKKCLKMAAIAGREVFRNPDETVFEDDFAMDSDGDYAMDEDGNLFVDISGEYVNPNDFDVFRQPV